MAPKKMSITAYPLVDQYAQLQQLSNRLKVPVAVLIREGIDLLLRSGAVKKVLEDKDLSRQMSFDFASIRTSVDSEK